MPSRSVGEEYQPDAPARIFDLEHRMARWPRRAWTTIFTYGSIFVLFPVLCLLAYAWVRGLLF